MKIDYLFNAIVPLESKVIQYKELFTGFRDPGLGSKYNHAD